MSVERLQQNLYATMVQSWALINGKSSYLLLIMLMLMLHKNNPHLRIKMKKGYKQVSSCV